MPPASTSKPRPSLSREEWLARRQARRERQREQNIVRAAQMHEARIAYKSSGKPAALVNLSDHHVGCSGWFYWHWRGQFYPAGSKTSDWFTYYAKRFKNRRTQRTLLRLANGRDGEDLEKAIRAPTFCLYGEGERAHHARQAVLADFGTRERLRFHRGSAWPSHGLLPFSSPAELQILPSTAGAYRGAT